MIQWTHSTDDTEGLFSHPAKIYFAVEKEWDEGGYGAHPDLGGGSPAGWVVDVTFSHVIFERGTELSREQVLGIISPAELAAWECFKADELAGTADAPDYDHDMAYDTWKDEQT